MTTAPICHLPGTTPDASTQPATFPAIPIATDLGSALMAVNAMRQIIHQTTGQSRPKKQSVNETGKFKKSKEDKNKPGRWVEVDRQHEKVKIENPDDPSQFVEIDRINRLTMQDTQTGETWVWNR